MKKIVLILILSLFICGYANACQTCVCTLVKAEFYEKCGKIAGSPDCCLKLEKTVTD